MSAGTARALASAGHRIAQALLTLGAAEAAHYARRDTGYDADLRLRLDELGAGVVATTDQIAAALRADGTATTGTHAARGGQPVLAGRLPPLRAQQQAIWQRPADEARRTGGTGHPDGEAGPVPPDSETAGLFAATDGLVDAINTAAHVLGGQAAPPPG